MSPGTTSRAPRGTRVFQWITAILVGAGVGLLAWQAVWPFDSHPGRIEAFDDPSIWNYLLGDQYVLGVFRLAMIAAALYILVSVPALVIAGRWLKGFGASGMSADDKDEAKDTISELEIENARLTNELEKSGTQVDRLTSERDQARGIARELLRRERGSRSRPPEKE